MANSSPVAFNPNSKHGDKDAFINVATGQVISLKQASALMAQNKGASKKVAIGVPNDYKVAPQLSPDQQLSQQAANAYGYPNYTIGPTYFKGDETGRGLSDFPTSPDDIRDLQKQLEKIGYLKAGSYIPSVWNNVSSAAFSNILSEANHAGTNWISQLNADSSAVDKAGSLADKQLHRNPLVIKLTDPAQIADTVNSVSKDLHGTYLSPDDIAKFTAQWQQQEKDTQTQAYAATGFDPITGQQDTSGLGSDPGQQGVDVTIKDPVTDMKAAASEKIRTEHPLEFQQNTFVDRVNEVLSALRGPGGNTTQVGPI